MIIKEDQASLFSSLISAIKEGNGEIALSAIEKFKKSQAVRIMDVAVIGPLMIYYGLKGRLGPIERSLLIIMGGGTIIYNYQNFKKNKIMGSIVRQAEDILVEQVNDLPNETRDVTPVQTMQGYY